MNILSWNCRLRNNNLSVWKWAVCFTDYRSNLVHSTAVCKLQKWRRSIWWFPWK